MLFSTACCHINELRERGAAFTKVDYSIRVDLTPRIYFTRAHGSESSTLVGVAGEASYATTFFEETLASFSTEGIAKNLSIQLPAALQKKLGWKPTAEGSKPEILFDLEVKEVRFLALDPVSPVSATWVARAALLEAGSRREIWRDCIEWTTTTAIGSMEDLKASRPESRQEALEELVGPFARQLARAIAADAGRVRVKGAKEGT